MNGSMPPRSRSLSSPLLDVKDLKTWFFIEHQPPVRAVDGVSFAIGRNRTLAIVGESGCGKSVTAYSILRLIQKPGRLVSGSIVLHPREGEPIDVMALDDRSPLLYRVRGGIASMIFQEPMTALSPVHSIGNQICETIMLHQKVGKREAEAMAAAMLHRVGIPAPEKRLRQYPHELSGGMRQRVMIAMALVCRPELLIADEPTTALDVTMQAQILLLIKDLKQELGTSVLLITHDLGVVAQTADDVAVMYLGRIVEQADVRGLFAQPRHPYTKGLMKSLPGRARRGERLAPIRGSVPSAADQPDGCPFHPRCDYAQAGRCDSGEPPLLRRVGASMVACHRAEEI